MKTKYRYPWHVDINWEDRYYVWQDRNHRFNLDSYDWRHLEAQHTWCASHCKTEWSSSLGKFFFDNQTDALRFRLRWTKFD